MIVVKLYVRITSRDDKLLKIKRKKISWKSQNLVGL